MIIETAYITVTPGREAEFLVALEEGKKILAQATGFKHVHVSRGIERDNVILLQIAWETLENHTVDFRGGELFPHWRAVISPFFAEGTAPAVEHWTPTSA
jgi:heme-degrading monooxygenase HmoA